MTGAADSGLLVWNGRVSLRVVDRPLGADALGSPEQRLALLEREVGVVQPLVGGSGDAAPVAERDNQAPSKRA